MAKGQRTNGKVYTQHRIEEIASNCGLCARWRCHGDTRDWFISREGIPCFQGGAERAVLWLQGYQRAVEDVGVAA